MSQQLLQTYQEPGYWVSGMQLIPGEILEKEAAHEKGLLHLSLHLLIYDPSGSILCRKRAADDLRYAGFWTSSIGVHVPAGSDYEETLKPLLPISLQIEFVGEFRVHDKWENEVNGLFIASVEDDELPEDFLENRKFLKRVELEKEIQEQHCTPHLAAAYDLLKKGRA